MLPLVGVATLGNWVAHEAAAFALSFGLKPLKYFVDSTFREKVRPVPGSVVYCDLWLAVEHSGIYIGDGRISNIEVDGLAESTVRASGPESFTSKSSLGRQIYVSCNRDGAVGHKSIARGAARHVGERAFYGLIVKNCHQFSTRCVNYARGSGADLSPVDHAMTMLPDGTMEPTMTALKRAARNKLGATKWRLWDWQSEDDGDERAASEPDWKAHEEHFENLPLDEEGIARIRDELGATQAYEEEIADESVPEAVRERLAHFRQTLSDVSQKYEEVKSFLVACPDARFSYAELKASGEDFAALAAQLQGNTRIKELARKMGRDYISEERKKKARVPEASKNEVHGTHRSDDVMRVLPCELPNLEDETLEVLFYARLLEKNLLTYELRGVTFISGEETERVSKRTGPIVACLDTSASMQGAPLLKAKALLLATVNILHKEGRSLHVLLFGAAGEIREFSMVEHNDAVGLLKFLQQGFGGGTDFESPLRRALSIISEQKNYKKADVLMISDGDCNLSHELAAAIQQQKTILDCAVYTVLCDGARIEDRYSDEVVVL
ncbi:VWA domain-containing protein [Azoarcus sp. KH32C]|uniref:VWA domain-containing protein n=1 Tax=Azoarcus sp. KH32C TaxID=748247 RepID=UPI0002385FBC|nr:VWA domain-containing protein [Azoarcus sp. KH32C]BAL23479.1 hypothetical protein AZKH_1150 [Azoarcus sp. KH32C]